MLMDRLADTGEHFTLTERRALVLAARRMARNTHSRRKLRLMIVVNMLLAAAVTNVRGTNFGFVAHYPAA